jgi:dedicated sortase system histidine kinase
VAGVVRRAAFGLRARLLPAALLLAAIPFVGYAYVRETEAFLRNAQEQALAATARAAAAALHDRPLLGTLATRTESAVEAPARAAAEEELAAIVRAVARSGARIWVVDREGRLLALQGSLQREETPAAGGDSWTAHVERALVRPVLERLLAPPPREIDEAIPESALSSGAEIERALAGVPAERRRSTADGRAVVLSAAQPVWNGSDVIGAVVIEESTLGVATLTYRAFERLVAATLAAFVLGGGVLFLYATRLSGRIVRLAHEAEAAIDSQGRVRTLVQGSTASDEIGDLSRSFSAALGRLAEHHDYLERLADRLSHELRTPVAVVASSLENLKSEAGDGAGRDYIERAEQALRRISLTLTRMREASRLEQTLSSAERERFDLAALVRAAAEGYRDAFVGRELVVEAPHEPAIVVGAPDLVAQLLDKLVENAADFAVPGTPIEIGVERDDRTVTLIVRNEGPPLPPGAGDRLFDSMVSLRDHTADGAGPHLGLGLFVVRQIAAFHGGTARARSREDGTGVEVAVAFPAT